MRRRNRIGFRSYERLWRASLLGLPLIAFMGVNAQVLPESGETPANADYEFPVYEVGYRRFFETDFDQAADVKVITEQAIRESRATSIPELLRSQANVFFRSYSGSGSNGEVSLRGFGENSGLRVLVLVDGQRLNRPDLAGIDWTQIPLSEVQSIEVIPGSQSVLYGDNAGAGVIRITTARGSAEGRQLTTGVTRGSYDFWNASANGFQSEKDLSLSAGVTYRQDGGYRENATSRSRSAHGGAGYMFGKQADARFQIDVTEGFNEFPGPLSASEFEANPRQSVSDGGTVDEESVRLAGTLNANPDRTTAATMDVGYTRRKDQSVAGSLISLEQNGSTVRDSEGSLENVLVSPSLREEFALGFVQTGFDVRLDRKTSLGYADRNFDPDRLRMNTIYRDATLERTTFSPYVFAQSEKWEGWVFSGGTRWEWADTRGENLQYRLSRLRFRQFVIDTERSFDSDVEKTGLAGEASALYAFDSHTNAWIGFDQLYRYPVLDEVASFQGFDLLVPFNIDLDPETGQSYEIGVRHRKDFLSLSGTLFGIVHDNEIAFDPARNLNVNLAPTLRLGTELGGSLDYGFWGSDARWQFVDARFTGNTYNGEPIDDRTVPLVPWYLGSLNVWVRPDDPIRISADAAFTGEQYGGNDFANTLPRTEAYTLFGATMDIDLNKHLNAAFRVDNLFDTRYASQVYSSQIYPGRGRYYEVSLMLKM